MTRQSLSVGKLEPDVLKQLVFSCLGAANSRVILGPSIGEDASVIDCKDKVLVVHSDPITGAVENIGWLAVNIHPCNRHRTRLRPLFRVVLSHACSQ